MHTPGRRGSAHPQTYEASFNPPALLLALGSHPGTHIPLQWGLERPFTGESGTPTTSQNSQHTS